MDFGDISWLDEASLEDGYKVYVALEGNTFWFELTQLLDTDPAPQRFVNTSPAIYRVGDTYTVRVRNGGTDEDTGTLIGEVTTTVVAAQ